MTAAKKTIMSSVNQDYYDVIKKANDNGDDKNDDYVG